MIKIFCAFTYRISRQPLDVSADPGDTVDTVIKTVLLTDKTSDTPTSSLHHHAPECYELRLHEGIVAVNIIM